MSTCVAELYVMIECTKEVIWERQLLEELGYKQRGANLLCVDNSAAISTCLNATLHKYTKPIGVRMSFLRENVGDHCVKPRFVGSMDNESDLFTKAQSKDRFLYNLTNIICE